MYGFMAGGKINNLYKDACQGGVDSSYPYPNCLSCVSFVYYSFLRYSGPLNRLCILLTTIHSYELIKILTSTELKTNMST